MPFNFNGGKTEDTITDIHESVQFRTPIISDAVSAIPRGKPSTSRNKAGPAEVAARWFVSNSERIAQVPINEEIGKVPLSAVDLIA